MRRARGLMCLSALVTATAGAPARALADTADSDAAPSALSAIAVVPAASHDTAARRRPSTAGLAILGTGAALFVIGDLMSDVCLGFDLAQLFDKQPPPRLVTQMVPPGLTMMGVGLVGIVTGAVLVLRSDPSLSPRTTDQAVSPLSVEKSIWMRAPTWGDGAPAAALPTAFGATVLSGRF